MQGAVIEEATSAEEQLVTVQSSFSPHACRLHAVQVGHKIRPLGLGCQLPVLSNQLICCPKLWELGGNGLEDDEAWQGGVGPAHLHPLLLSVGVGLEQHHVLAVDRPLVILGERLNQREEELVCEVVTHAHLVVDFFNQSGDEFWISVNYLVPKVWYIALLSILH